MIRRGQQKKRALKQAREAAETDPHRGEYRPPARSECYSRQWHTAYDNSTTVRTQFNLWKQGSVIVDFSIIIQRLSTAGWEDVERFDCCHGHCHLHTENRDASEPIHRLDAVTDVQPALTQASLEAHQRARIIRDKGV